MNRGSTACIARRPGRACPFNEAPIHESGKFALHLASRPQPATFNEAPIHESGKYSGRSPT